MALIGRMLERATEVRTDDPPPEATVVTGRFARDPSHFTIRTPQQLPLFEPGDTTVRQDDSKTQTGGGAA